MAELHDCSKHIMSSSTDAPAPSPWEVGDRSAHTQSFPQLPDRGSLTPALPRIVPIRPAATAVRGKPDDKLDNAIKANVAQGVERLTGLDPILSGPVKEGDLKVVGAVYELRTGLVNFLD
jgi:carbonic anhydrase